MSNSEQQKASLIKLWPGVVALERRSPATKPQGDQAKSKDDRDGQSES